MISSFLLSQILIGIAFIFDLSSFQFKNRKHILICFTIAASLISAHFFLLGEYTAGSVVALSAVRFIVSIFTTNKRMLWLFLVLILIAGVVTFDGFEDILSVSAMLLSTFSAFSAADKKLRLFMMCGTVLMITHNIIIFTPAAILLESFFLASNLFAYYRYYLKPKNIGLKRGTVSLVEHTSDWVKEFDIEKKLLLNTFKEKILAIEHIGSTAIAGIPAKPIIDINVAIESLDDIDDFISKLQELGYEYIPERKYADRQFFPKGPSERRTHHLNLVELDSPTAWRNQLLFRDYLRSHKDEREAYAELKRSLANKYADNREEYTERKSNFVLKIIEKALAESNL